MSATLTKQTDSDEDPVTLMLQKTGCLEKHYKVQECIAETQDWRKCQEIVKDFKDLMLFLSKLKLVVVIRSDLKLTKGKIASQAAHAAVSCFKRALDSKQSVALKWLDIGQPKIILKVDTQEELESLRQRAIDSDLVTALIRDAGRTQVSFNTVTCLGIGPDYDEKIDAIVKDLKLL